MATHAADAAGASCPRSSVSCTPRDASAHPGPNSYLLDVTVRSDTPAHPQRGKLLCADLRKCLPRNRNALSGRALGFTKRTDSAEASCEAESGSDMACFKPLKGWRAQTVNEKTGKRPVVFSRSRGLVDLPVELPCGQCIGCRLERSRQWAMRCVHEASLHDDNIFITLTYDNEHLPPHGSLYYRDFQLFMKRLLVHTERHTNRPLGVRFYMCGEYGENFGRPHYHAIMFNYDLVDKVLWRIDRDNPLYTSQTLTHLWGKGHTSIGGVTFQSAAYVARYIMKKVTGPEAENHYNVIDQETGEVLSERRPEFTNMSRRPGIGGKWFDKFQSDVFPGDFVVLNGRKVTPPRFYTNRYELLYPDEVVALKARRKERALRRAHDNTPQRLKVREQVLESRISRLKRTIE